MADTKMRDLRFKSLSDVHAWIDNETADGRDGIARLRMAIKDGKLEQLTRGYSLQFLGHHEIKEEAERKVREAAQRKVEVEAALRQADAAEEANQHARESAAEARSSARSARIAWYIAGGVLVFEVVKYLIDRLERT